MAFSDIFNSIDEQVNALNQQQAAKSGNNIGQQLLNVLGGAGVGYLTGGLGNYLLSALGGAGTAAEAMAPVAGVLNTVPGLGTALEASGAMPVKQNILQQILSPNTGNVLAALEAGASAMGGTEPTKAGITAGLQQPINTLKSNIEQGVAGKLGLTPSTYSKGETSYGRPALTLADIQKATSGLPADYTTSYGFGKGGVTANVRPPSKTKPPVSMGRLTPLGANAFSAAQSAIDNGKDSAEVIKAIYGATDIPTGEKPIIIKNLRAKKKPGRTI